MQYAYTLGIDISKRRLDWAIMGPEGACESPRHHPNTPEGIHAMISEWGVRENLLVCFEHTGIYGWTLALLLEHHQIPYVMVPALHVQRSMGLQRGKSDPIDARRLAEFAFTHQRTLRPFTMPAAALLELRGWLVWREHLVKTRAGLIRTGKNLECLPAEAHPEHLLQQVTHTRQQLTESIDQADRQIRQVIEAHSELHMQYKLLTSIPGIGPLIASWLMVYTHGFSRFDTARQLACYVGTAPFPHRSGSTHKADRVSRYRCARLKGLLYNGAHSAVRYDPELAHYFTRKTEQGKHPQSVMNAVVCKMIYRAFAVIKRGSPYVNTYANCIAVT